MLACSTLSMEAQTNSLIIDPNCTIFLFKANQPLEYHQQMIKVLLELDISFKGYYLNQIAT